MKAELKQLNKNKQLASPAIKMEDVQDLINNEKAIIINQFSMLWKNLRVNLNHQFKA